MGRFSGHFTTFRECFNEEMSRQLSISCLGVDRLRLWMIFVPDETEIYK